MCFLQLSERFIRENVLEPTKLDFLRRLYSCNNIADDSDSASSADDFDDTVADDSDHFFDDAISQEDAESLLKFQQDISDDTSKEE